MTISNGMVSLKDVENAISYVLCESRFVPINQEYPIMCQILTRLTKPKTPAPEDRVKKFFVSADNGYCVVVDQNRDHPLTAYKMEGKVADVYYNYVIETLKKEGTK